jgi:Flp pilus assembly protein TadG
MSLNHIERDRALKVTVFAILHRIGLTVFPLNWRKAYKKSRGQSMVELAIALPLIILLFSGLIELGFILNYYLSLLDATREAARIYSTQDPFNDDLTDNMLFYQSTASMVFTELAPYNAQDTTRKIILDPNADDIIVSVFNVKNNSSTPNPANVCNPANPNPEKTITRHPTSSPTPGSFRYYENLTSGVSATDVCAHLISGSSPTALLLVEVFYGYHQTLALPWLAPFMSNPVILHAQTMMPMPPTTLFHPAPMDFALLLPPWEN